MNGSATAKVFPLNADLSQCENEASCSWDFGDGTTAKGCEAKNHSYSSLGDYQVTVTMDCGKATQTSKRQIRVEPVVQCTFKNPFRDAHYDTEIFVESWWDVDDNRKEYQFHVEGWNGENFGERVTKDVDTEEASIEYNGYRYYTGETEYYYCDSVECDRHYEICREPIN